MEHSNKVIRKVLSDEFSDYHKNQWHYNREYKLCEEAIKATSKLNEGIRESDHRELT